MPPDDADSGNPADWLRHARSDLAYASAPVPAEGLLEVPCFHAQQAAEKAIKAVLIAYGIAFPKTHNLQTLIEMLPRGLPIPAEVLQAVILTNYAAATRYPGEFEPVSEAEYIAGIALARAVLAWAEAAVAATQDQP